VKAESTLLQDESNVGNYEASLNVHVLTPILSVTETLSEISELNRLSPGLSATRLLSVYIFWFVF
jgi:hypothetical protein